MVTMVTKLRSVIQLNLPLATTQNVKPGWSLTGRGRLREIRPDWVKILPHYHKVTWKRLIPVLNALFM